MKYLLFVSFTLVMVVSCGDSKKQKRKQFVDIPAHPWDIVIDSMTMQHCQCVFNSMRMNKPSTTNDYCSKVVSARFQDTLKALGYYEQTGVRDVKSSPVLRMKPCKEMYDLLAKESEESEAKKLLFHGEIISQKQRKSGEVEIVLTNKVKNETRTFISKTFLEKPFQNNKRIIDYEITIEYEVRHNPQGKQDEYYVKENGTRTVIGVIRTGD